MEEVIEEEKELTMAEKYQKAVAGPSKSVKGKDTGISKSNGLVWKIWRSPRDFAQAENGIALNSSLKHWGWEDIFHSWNFCQQD